MTADKKYKVAVYGSLRKGLGNHVLLKKAKYLGRFETPAKYTMYSVNLMFPGLKKKGNTCITMEAYEVTKEELVRINLLEGFEPNRTTGSNHYNRFSLNTPFGEAYCFEYASSTDNLYTVDSGDWVSFRNNHQFLK